MRIRKQIRAAYFVLRVRIGFLYVSISIYGIKKVRNDAYCIFVPGCVYVFISFGLC